MGKILLALLLGTLLLEACGNEPAQLSASDTHAVDSAARVAPDTIRASMDTTSRLDTGSHEDKADKTFPMDTTVRR